MQDDKQDQWPLSNAQMATPARLGPMPVLARIFKLREEGGESLSKWDSVTTRRSIFSSLISIFAMSNLGDLEGPARPLMFQVPILKALLRRGTGGAPVGAEGWVVLTGSE